MCGPHSRLLKVLGKRGRWGEAKPEAQSAGKTAENTGPGAAAGQVGGAHAQSQHGLRLRTAVHRQGRCGDQADARPRGSAQVRPAQGGDVGAKQNRCFCSGP